MSDWSSDVCSSDLPLLDQIGDRRLARTRQTGEPQQMRPLAFLRGVRLAADLDRLPVDILRPPERELDQPGPHRRVGHLVDQDEPAQIPIIAIALEHDAAIRSEEHTSELQSLMRISYAVS